MTVLRYTRRTAPRDRLDYSQWASVTTDDYDQQAQRRFALLTAAIKDYIDGQPFDKDLEKDGIYRQTLLRCFNRCITPDGNGRLFGWRGLCPGIRVRAPERRKPLIPSGRNRRGGLTGALTLFLNQHAEIAGAFEKYLLANAKRSAGHEARLREKSAHAKFIELCEEGGVQAWEWPLCTRRQGRESIRQHVSRFVEARYDDIVGTQFGNRAKARSNTGRGYESRLLACRPFDIVEVDEHKCGFIGSIGIPTPEGTRWFPIERVTIILVVDRWLSLILGYKAIFRREANADDVLDALNSALGNGTPRSHCEGYEAESSVGLPSELGEVFTWCGFNQVLFDNALIHIATEVSERARDLIGCDFNFGPVRRFERRATVENVFGGLERLGFRRLQSTVGTSPQDPMRQKPEQAAVATKLTIRQVLDLIESVVADHNCKQSKSSFGSRPLTRLEAAWRDVDGIGVIFPALPPLAPGVAGLDVSVVTLNIHGSKDKGRRPYFTFEGEAYTGIEMAKNWTLSEMQAVGHIRRDAIREIMLFSSSGEYIDTAKVMGRWRHTEHSRDTRRHINALIQDGYLKVRYSECPVHRFLESVKESVRRETTGASDISRADLAVLAAEKQARINTAAWEVDESLEKTLSNVKEGATRSIPDDSEDFLDYNGLSAFSGSTG